MAISKEEKFITQGELCKKLGITHATFKKIEKQIVIPYYQMGVNPKYKYSEVLKALKEKKPIKK